MMRLEDLTVIELLQLQNDCYRLNMWQADEVNDSELADTWYIIIESNRQMIALMLDCNGGWNAPFML